MPEAQSIYFIVPAKDVEMVKSTARREYPNTLIGTKRLPDGSALLAITLYSEYPVSSDELLRKLADHMEISGISQPQASMRELVEKLKKAQENRE